MSDESLTGPALQSHGGLDYPLGKWTPPPGEPHEIAPGVRWLRMGLPFVLDHINLWLLDDHDAQGPGTTIVDTGICAPACTAIWEGLLPGLRVTRIIGTHFHPDHVGLAGWLSRRTGASLWMTRGEYLMARMVQLDARDTPPPEAVEFAVEAGWSTEAIDRLQRRGWRHYASAASPLPARYHRMTDGQKIMIGDRCWQVVVGSGHSPEHACLVSDDGSLMISGDQVLPRITPNVSVPMMEPLGDPLGDWLASIERLRRLPDTPLVLPSHGLPFHGLHARLDQLAQGHHQQLEALHDFCATPRQVIDCFPVLFRRPIDETLIGMATGEALAHLRRLEMAGRMRRERQDGVLRFTSI